MSPITELKKKNHKIKLNDKCEEVFQKIKKYIGKENTSHLP